MNLTEKEQPRALAPDDPRVVHAVEEYVSALEGGKHPDREAFLARHADIRSVLAGCLDGLQFIRAARPQLDDASAAEDTFAAPLGDFRILREIGRGGMGIVYEAEQMSLGRRVALKVLPFAATLDPKQLQRFKNEAQAAGQLHHTNIVAVHFVGCERGVHFYAMQYIDGQSLAELIADLRLQNADLPKRADSHAMQPGTQSAASVPQSAIRNLISAIADTPPQGRLSTQQSIQSPNYFLTMARLGIQAAEALDHAHELGVLHRDIKPANLLVDFRGNLWVTDFGLAQIQGDNKLTLTGDLLGTLRYMSPEQALAKRVLVDHRTDIYSLGATLYELLTLEPVFAGADRQELLRQIAFEEPTAARRHNKSIPHELETIVLKAMEKNPADRYATAKELAEDLERFVKDEPIRARRPSAIRRVKGLCRRHKTLVTGVVVLVLTALLLGAGLLWSRERQRAAIEQGVAEDLKEAKSWQEKEVWAKALQALERAAGRLEGSAPSPLKEEVDKRRQEAALIACLEEAHMKATSKRFYGQPDFAGADLAYGKAFAVHGLDVTTLKAEEIVRSIKDSPIQTQLVAALDYWAYVKDNLRGGSGEPLRAIANLADDDPWRRQLRDPRVAKSLDTLEALAAGKDILAQPPTNLLLLSYLFEGVAGSDASARQRAMTAEENLLRRAQVHYPADFRIAMALASKFKFLPDGAFAPDTINFLRVAVALQPQVGDNYVFLGIMLGQQQKWAEAEVAFKRAIDLNPKDDHAYFFFGNFLAARGRLCESVDAYRKAIDCKPEALSMALCDGACAAARAGCGEKDAAKLDAMERARLREQARAWLKEALVIWRSNLDKSTDKGRANVGGQMQEWLQDRDFEGVRGAAGMAKLIVAERREWKKLWEEVNELWKRATEAK